MSLAGKRVLVTGGGSGAGASLALGFADRGADVIVCGRRMEALERTAALHSAIRAIPCDVADEQSVIALFREAGTTDIVIANAGQSDSDALVKTSLTQWNAMLAVNLTGVFLTFREGLRQMPGWGRLIAIASTAGLKGYARVAPYAAAKHGVVGLTRSLALEVARTQVTVNAICPGFLDTEMTAQSIRKIVEKTGRSEVDALAVLQTFNPQKRLISPGEVTATALWLCGPGSEGINGQAVAISGGEV
jgi:NAD(P)-dependent dehydrogenase (short-subunit alcohol dehydrogenase family)